MQVYAFSRLVGGGPGPHLVDGDRHGHEDKHPSNEPSCRQKERVTVAWGGWEGCVHTQEHQHTCVCTNTHTQEHTHSRTDLGSEGHSHGVETPRQWQGGPGGSESTAATSTMDSRSGEAGELQ